MAENYQSSDEPIEPLTALANVGMKAMTADPSIRPGIKFVILVTDKESAGLAIHGYTSTFELVGDMAMAGQAMIENAR